MSRDVKILQLLPAFKKKFFYNWGKQLIPYALQRRAISDVTRYGKIIPAGTIDYDFNLKGTINDQLLLNHFRQKPIESRYYETSSIAVKAGGWDILKWIAIDVDSAEQIEAAHKKILPALRAYGLEPLVETSHGGRMHLWIFGDFSPKTADRFMRQLFIECEENLLHWEIYPLFQKKDLVIRIPGGYHFKAGKVSPVIVGDTKSAEADFVMQAVIDAPAYTEEYLASLLKFIVPEPAVQRERKEFKPGRFTYLSRNMPLPMEGLPPYLQVMGTECQAIRKLMLDTAQHDQIEKAGINHHNTLLMFAGLSRYIDHISKTDEGSKWFETVTHNFRSRGIESHGLEERKGKSPHVGAWKCDTLDKHFGLCEGCPFRKRDGFDTPVQLFFGKKVRKVKVADVY